MKLRIEMTIDNEAGHGVFVVVDVTPPDGNPPSMSTTMVRRQDTM